MITFENGFLSTLILDAKDIFTSFLPLVVFLVSILVAFHLLQMIKTLIVGKKRRLEL